MRRGRFVDQRSPEWSELEALLERKRLDRDQVLRLGALYRAAAADLAVARRAFPGDPVTERLHALVLRARQAVYGSAARGGSVRHFVTTGYWRRLRERPGLLAISIGLLLVPTALSYVWGLHDPGAALGVVPGPFRHRGASPVAGSLSVSDEAGFAGEIFTNNIRVTFAAVALGITLGIGSAVLAVYNGVMLGALGGIAQHDGTGRLFVSLVAGHGILEMSCIAVAVMAGLRIGWAIVEPGRLSRGASLRAQARPAMEIVLGTMPWLVLAGLVEGFFTGSAPSLPAALVLGFGLGGLFWALVWLRGGRAPSP